VADMTPAEYDLDEIRRTRIEREAYEALLKPKVKAWKDAIRKAAEAGVPKPVLAEVAGVNRQRIYKILSGTDDE
jgi:hypothetical protein